jgi:hypothetical protein
LDGSGTALNISSCSHLDSFQVSGNHFTHNKAKIVKYESRVLFKQSYAELDHSVHKLGLLDDGKQFSSLLDCSQDDVAGSRKPSMRI